MKRRDAIKHMGLGASGVAAASLLGTAKLTKATEHHDTSPVGNIDLYFCGFHLAKSNPDFQIETQHYCCAHGEGMHQCVLYDRRSKHAKLLGVEYIILDEMYRQLPEEERKYWHPHTYEVLGGGLIAPEMKQEDEDAFMKALLLTWGKAFHVWPDPTTKIPMGEPLLMWSLMGDGQADEEMVKRRDKEFGVSTEKIAERRQKLLQLPKPNVDLPKNVEFIGRQWTNAGADTPEQRTTELGK